MASNEHTSSKVATLAAKVLVGKRPTAREAKILAASALTQVLKRR